MQFVVLGLDSLLEGRDAACSVRPVKSTRFSITECFHLPFRSSVLTEDTGLNIVFVRRENTEDRPVTIPRTNVGIFKQSSIVLLMMSQYSYIGTPVLLYWYWSLLISVLESSYYEDWAGIKTGFAC